VKRKRTWAERKFLMDYHFGSSDYRRTAKVEFQVLIMTEESRVLRASLDDLEAKIERDKEIQAVESHQAPEPPRLPEFLLVVFASAEYCDAWLGDLNERFTRDCQAVGLSRARRLYWARSLRSLWPVLQRAIARGVKWGAILSTLKRLMG